MSDSIPIITPDLGTDGPLTLSAWLVDEGESVREGDRLVELLIPGLTYDLAAPAEGWLERQHIHSNAKAFPGDVLGTIRPGTISL